MVQFRNANPVIRTGTFSAAGDGFFGDVVVASRLNPFTFPSKHGKHATACPKIDEVISLSMTTLTVLTHS